MPLKKGSSKETISKNIETEMKSYKKSGKIGTSKPGSKKKAVKQAAAIAYAKAGKGKKKDENCENMKKFPLKKLREETESEKADKDYDGDGEVESKKDEYFGSKDKAIKKAMGKKEDENSEETIKESFHAFVKATLRKVFSLE